MVTKELLEYIKVQRGIGKSDEDIKQSLLSVGGWTSVDIDEALSAPKNKNFIKFAVSILILIVFLSASAYLYYTKVIQKTIMSNSDDASLATIDNQNTNLSGNNSILPPTSTPINTDNTSPPESTNQPANLTNNSNSEIVVIFPEPDVIRLCPVCDLNLSVAIGEISIPIQDTNNKFTPLLNMIVQGSIYNNQQYPQKLIKKISMSDNVVNGSGHPNDGIYISEPITKLPAGTYSVFYTVKGTDSQGHVIDKKSNPSEEITNVDVSTGNAQILKIEDEGIDINGDGSSGVIQANFWLTAKKQGTYNLSAIFVSPNGQEIPLSKQIYLVGGGQAEAKTLLLDSRDDGSKMANGVYKIKNIYLFENINNRLAWVDTWVNGDGIYITKNYKVK